MRFKILFLLLLVGCQRTSSLNHRPEAPREVVAASSDQLELDGLLQQYDGLPQHEKDALAGDKLIMQMEIFLKAMPTEQQSRAMPVVRAHNERLVKRALNDPDFEEIIGTEFAPTPRER